MLYMDLEWCVSNTLNGLEVFGEPIGQPLYPYIVLVYNPRVDHVTSQNLPLVVHEIRVRFKRIARDPFVGYKLVPRSQVTSLDARWKLVGANKLMMYGGDHDHDSGTTQQEVILPFIY